MEPFRRSLRTRLGQVIEHRRDDILQRWLERVTKDMDVSGVALTDLKNALPVYLIKVQETLETSDIEIELSGSEAWAFVAREHAVTRVHLGFDVTQLIHEFIVLRRVLEEVAAEEGVSGGVEPHILAELVEAGISVAVKAYVGRRDEMVHRTRRETIGFLMHELRNPLNTAILATAQLRRRATADQLRSLDIVERNQKRLLQQIDGILSAERLDAKKVEIHPAKVVLRDVLGEAIASGEEAAAAKGLVFRTRFAPDIALEIDPTLTRSAVQNLIDNSIKFTDRGYVELTVDDLPAEVVIHVRDTGQGIAEDERRRIFEPFVRGETEKPGTGLGLAIARGAVEVQGGELDVESSVARGAHFWIRLPKCAQAHMPDPAA